MPAAYDVEALTRNMLERQSFQTAHKPAYLDRSAGGELRTLYGAVKNPELMAEREDFQDARFRSDAKTNA
jgi:hypothetical protein